MALPLALFAQGENSKQQYLTTNHQLNLKAAYALAESARAKATAMGKQVSIAIVDQSGVSILITAFNKNSNAHLSTKRKNES